LELLAELSTLLDLDGRAGELLEEIMVRAGLRRALVLGS
jgi:hypothetical protein